MIYLTRTTIDGAIEIAVLEDGARLGEYEAQGFAPVPYDVYRDAWRKKSTALYEALRRIERPAPQQTPAEVVRCPRETCRSLRVGLRAGVWRCRKCKHEWGER